MANQDQFGPVEYIAVEFPDGTVTADGFEQLLAAVDNGTIRILDLEFVAKAADSSLSVVPASTFDLADFDLSQFDGAASGLLDAADIAAVGEDIAAGSVAAVLVYEEMTLLPVLDAWARAGGRVITEGHISLDELATALNETENEA
ncbi:DUF6325 family protein [Rhodococcus sp. OK302]|uniref:DUF6325 family protein n=1 Tax=Rhodococcus sp. OK302 TaxID=1882769 RepID=UPI000B940E84|nr:DUF6325 family protein [Rhodococcus sp. OK302]OYD67482.1 hypothetical protein BDB13_1006 [Rhodococcus sp. OK302]